MRRYVLPLVLAAAIGFLIPEFGPRSAQARSLSAEFAQTLSKKDRERFETYLKTRTFFEAERDAFWGKVSTLRKKRRQKKRAGKARIASDYVKGHPPKYKGPSLGKRLAAKWSKFKSKARGDKKPKPRKPLPGLSQYLGHSKKQYGFSPQRIPERKFKKRYAREALRLGLSKEQVVRVYALETGGNGTADMQAGIHPISKKGRPISSALGYAQLLAANSVSEIVIHGPPFIERMKKMVASSGLSDKRKKMLQHKIAVLRAMLRNARSVPNKWSHHVKYARTARGMGIHALNMDGDIGPWLQVNKLLGIMKFAERSGRPNLNSAELELMNLAGPSRGLEMLTKVGSDASTVNFFSRRGYERNSIVRGKSGLGLLKALEERMNVNVKNKGAIEFGQVFDELKNGN